MARADLHCVPHAALRLVGSNHHWLPQVLGRARTGVGSVPTTMAARASDPARRVRAATRLFSTYLPRELVGTRALAGGFSTDSRAGRIKGVRGPLRAAGGPALLSWLRFSTRACAGPGLVAGQDLAGDYNIRLSNECPTGVLCPNY